MRVMDIVNRKREKKEAENNKNEKRRAAISRRGNGS